MRRLGDLARLVGGVVVGDAERSIVAVRSLEAAGPEDLAPLTSALYLEQARQSRAGAILSTAAAQQAGLAADLVLCEHPAEALVVVLEALYPRRAEAPGVHPSAVVAPSATVASSATVGPFAVVGEEATLGEGVRIGSHAVVGRGCRIGDGAILHPHVVLYDRVLVGERTEIHAGAVIGADGFGYVSRGLVHRKVPQVGGVRIGADVEIGAGSAIDRATLEETTIGDGTKIDNLVQVGHNVQVGAGCLLCGQAGIAGSAKLGDGVVLAGQSGVAGHLELGTGVRVAAQGAVLSSVGSGLVGGTPAVPIERWRRQVAALGRLADALRRLRRIERALIAADLIAPDLIATKQPAEAGSAAAADASGGRAAGVEEE
jgi:UDP-3-O-[3-hydroxymyristoyl] glucosamine N-acyltransferase